MTSTETVTPEAAVRLYLMYLDDPAKLVDAAAVRRLESDVRKARDPIDRLRAAAALEKAKATDGTGYRADFVRFAKPWADEESIPVSAFRQLGVPRDVLAEAARDGRARGRRGRAPPRPVSGGPR